MDQKKVFHKVAEVCPSYTKQQNDGSNSFSNSTNEDDTAPSCLSCENFKNNHCQLDLYDKIHEHKLDS